MARIALREDDTISPPARKRRVWGNVYFQIIVAILAGGLLGFFFPAYGEALHPLGVGFIKLVKMVIAPVIFLTVTTGIAGMRDLAGLGRVTAKAFGYFFVASTFALILGLVVANVFRPGAGMNIDPATLDPAALTGFVNAAHEQSVASFLLAVIPETVVGAFASGELLQVLLFSVLFGVAASIAGEPARPVLAVLEAASAAFFKLVHIVMKAAPIGAFGAFAFTIGRYGVDTIANLATLVATFYATSAFFIFVVLGVIARACGFSIFRLVAYLREEILLVLGTSSSESALPALIEKLERAGCEKSVVGVVVPTGYSFNLDGTNIYMTLAVLFIAQATGIELTFADQALLLSIAVLSSKGAAGVTGAGFVTLAATLTVVPSVPVAGIALILGVDRFMSECRSVTNFIGNAVATIVVAKWENKIDETAFASVLRRGAADSASDAAAPGDPAADGKAARAA
ncbi:MAG: dicarboxylate/amino acid:cation symporter [Pseudomonadota bacterium]|nr:dicarboxylate/amino acid:cation symporter [Pseudomonadota bacterium]